MEQESETVPQQEDHGICLSCNKRKEKIVKHSTVDHEEEQSFFEKERGILTNPLTSKLQNFRQIFEGPKNSNSSTECLEKKGTYIVIFLSIFKLLFHRMTYSVYCS